MYKRDKEVMRLEITKDRGGKVGVRGVRFATVRCSGLLYFLTVMGECRLKGVFSVNSAFS